MTHPEVEHGQGAVWRHRPQSESLVWGKKGHCQRKSWKASFNRFANNVREALGLSPIQPFHPHGHPHHNPPAMAGEAAYPPIATPVNTEYDHVMRKPDARWPMPFHHQGQDRHHRFHHHRGGDWHKKPFSRRIMHALYILGPVEGRIVAFVLGLGIGALIRVIFVMGILAYRSFTRRERGIRLPEDEEESEPIIVERIFEVKENEKAPAYTAVVSDGEQTLAPPS
ncbi:hypothetical protein CALCODRAFT_74783 [Calocera cornea HHB12733]|uniref:Uncharacterized protein n=1 Tax=Calocera cornea HHB12733 TaxID=1353952 RepID=A0A165DI83_9BASI|nr:hypothetical protein CALCODRAFT_74783 [Calocera cornea HHB12733]